MLIASLACMLSFSRKKLWICAGGLYPGISREFYSAINDRYHKGEFNPREKALVLSWKDFEEGYQITNDKRNLGIHEFMHAMQLESKSSRIWIPIVLQTVPKHPKAFDPSWNQGKVGGYPIFREYAFTNQYEFMAVWQNIFWGAPGISEIVSRSLHGYKKNAPISGLLAIEDFDAMCLAINSAWILEFSMNHLWFPSCHK